MAIRVLALSPATGAGYDLTDVAEGLTWSSTNPGGDERAAFRLKRQWFSGAPEITQGNILRIIDGLSVLWQGRIEEQGRSSQDAESIDVTAYGLGTRLKDTKMVEVYVDRDTSAWGDPPLNRKVGLAVGGLDTGKFSWTQEGGGLVCSVPNEVIASGNTIAETWYIAPSGVTIAKVMYVGNDTTLPAGWEAPSLFNATADDATGTASVAMTFDGTLRTATPANPRRYNFIREYTLGTAGSTPAAGTSRRVKAIGTYGSHGLTTRAIDSTTPDGLWISDIVNDIIGRSSGITRRRIEAATFVCPHLVFLTPVTLEEALQAADVFQGNDWGVWGPNSTLDTSLNGYFDYTARDLSTAHWTARRADCDGIDLNTEMGTLYNSVDVTYVDPSTSGQQIVTRTTSVAALTDAGVSRKASLDAGTNTASAAAQLGDVFLALTNQQTPARGVIQLSGSVRHYLRGAPPAHFMRADGSNIRVADVLPSKEALALTQAPDRRTTFPIKRVEVDASGTTPKVNVEVDQSRDLLSILQARLAVTTSLIIGR